MDQRKKRLLEYTLKNLGTFIGYTFLFMMAAMLMIVGIKMVVGVWGETVGFITFGFVLGLIGLTGVAYMKAKEDLRSAEREEERIMNRMRQGDVGFPGIHNP